MKKYDGALCNCESCIGFDFWNGCNEWTKELGAEEESSCSMNGDKFYANREQVEPLLDYHNKKYGTIQDRLARESDGETLLFGYVDGKWQETWPVKSGNKKKKDFDFRVGDQVYSLINGNGEVYELQDEKHSVVVSFPGHPDQGDLYEYFTRDGIGEYGPFQVLFHGNDLKVTVEEKKPIRTVERWVVNFLASNKEVCVYQCNTKEHMDERIETWPSNWGEIVNGPVKVQIPE